MKRSIVAFSPSVSGLSLIPAARNCPNASRSFGKKYPSPLSNESGSRTKGPRSIASKELSDTQRYVTQKAELQGLTRDGSPLPLPDKRRLCRRHLFRR